MSRFARSAQVFDVSSVTGLGSMSLQNSSHVSITGGTITGISLGTPGRIVSIVATTPFNVTDEDTIVVTSDEDVTVNLVSSGGGGGIITIKNIGAGTVTVDAHDNETIDGEATQLVYQYEGITLVDYDIGSWIAI
jgi:hypothetical protein